MPPEKTRPSCLTYGEAHTASGQIISFWFDDRKEGVSTEIKAALANAWDASVPESHLTNAEHGCFGRYSRYRFKQHKYAGYEEGAGYTELLEITNAPDGRCGIVIHSYWAFKGEEEFIEWENLEDARRAWKEEWNKIVRPRKEELEKMPGFRRFVPCGALSPWFYAVGNQELIGDYVFPEGLQDDPVFSFGRKFVLSREDGETIKTCLGCRFLHDLTPEYNLGDRERRDTFYRLVYWDDGTVRKIQENESDLPRPLDDSELWIFEAMKEFRRLLSGRIREFTIRFFSGGNFTGAFKPEKSPAHSPEGDYLLAANLEGEEENKRGWITDWKPTNENPNVIQFAKQKLEKKTGKKVLRIEIIKKRVKTGGQQWAGVFLPPPQG